MKRISGCSKIVIVTIVLSGLVTSCKEVQKTEPPTSPPIMPEVSAVIPDYDTTKWTELRPEDGYIIDIKYATSDNFVGEVIYPCGRMFLRPDVAIALSIVNQELLAQGYQLKLFDGYRPRPAQQKLWDKVPNRNYVAPPSEGSMHNRGVAVDLTLADPGGNEIDMGTPYDFFGREAHHDYSTFPPEVLKHRQLLKGIMEQHGFQSIRTEWWHYSFTKSTHPLDDWQWACEH
jgi:zinc D-Ala-D-Ala dipeptidase